MLIVRDGWGRNPNPSHDAFNAIKIARTPFADELEETRPVTLIKTSGLDVGLPDGTMGANFIQVLSRMSFKQKVSILDQES